MLAAGSATRVSTRGLLEPPLLLRTTPVTARLAAGLVGGGLLSPCPNCGAQNPQNFSFCSVCAHALSEAALVAAPPAMALQFVPEAAAVPGLTALRMPAGMRALDVPAPDMPASAPRAGIAGLGTSNTAAPLIRIEVDRSKEFRVGSTCYLDFRVSATGLWPRINVVVQIVAGIGNRDEEHEFELSLDEQERSATHSWRFVPRMPGEQQIRSLRVAVQDLDDGKRLAFARMRREAMSFHVSPEWSSEGSRITIQGSVYGSLVGREATQRPASPGYADELLRWAPLPLVEDREPGWWEGRKVDIAREAGGVVITWHSGDAQRSLFVIAGEVARIGRRKEDCDIVARWLPCRSREQDPENWALNQSISRAHLRVLTTADGVAVEAERSASSPTHLELEGSSRRLSGERWRVSHETRLRLGAASGAPHAGLLLAIAPVVQDRHTIGALVTRPENAPEHAYLLLSNVCEPRRSRLPLDGLPESIEIAPVEGGIAVRAPALQRSDRRTLEVRGLTPDDFTRYPA